MQLFRIWLSRFCSILLCTGATEFRLKGCDSDFLVAHEIRSTLSSLTSRVTSRSCHSSFITIYESLPWIVYHIQRIQPCPSFQDPQWCPHVALTHFESSLVPRLMSDGPVYFHTDIRILVHSECAHTGPLDISQGVRKTKYNRLIGRAAAE